LHIFGKRKIETSHNSKPSQLKERDTRRQTANLDYQEQAALNGAQDVAHNGVTKL